MRIPTHQLTRVLGQELFVWRKAALAVFLAVNVAAVGLALVWSKSYTAWTSIFVEDKNILDPLMQGAAVRAPLTDRSRIAKEVIFSQRVMQQLAADLGWFNENPGDAEKERIMNGLRGRTTVSSAGRSIIRIEHSSSDPIQAYRTTKRIAELFMLESHEKKYEESKAAYEFIDKQVQEYYAKLAKSEDELKQLRSANIDSGGSAGGADVVTRLNQLRTRLEQSREELRESEIKKAALERQLAGETETSLVLTRTGQYRTRISELQAQLSTLQMSYHDTHPDVVRIRHQIEDLHEAIRVEEARRQAAPRTAPGDAAAQASDEGVVHNPIYQQLRQDLAQTRIQISTLSARIADLERQSVSEQRRGKEVQSEEAILAQLTRDQQVNNAIYQDLLRRRENALISMNMNQERQGLGFSIQDEATVPLGPSGLRPVHIVLIGILLSVLIPVGGLFALVSMDGRIRVPTAVAEHFKVPVLGTIPHMWSPPEVARIAGEFRWAVVLTAGTALLLVAVSVLRWAVYGS